MYFEDNQQGIPTVTGAEDLCRFREESAQCAFRGPRLRPSSFGSHDPCGADFLRAGAMASRRGT